MKYAMVGTRPLPKKLAAVATPVLAEAGAILVSGARNQAAIAYARTHGGGGAQSQEELYRCWVGKRDTGVCRCTSCNPANPPGQSTHEGKNDGVAYRFWPKFKSLPWWAWGQDLTNSQGVVQIYNRHGFSAAITYPGDPREGHHVNLRKKPSRPALKWARERMFPTLKKGDKGRRVGTMTKRLYYLGWLHDEGGGGPTGNFNERVQDALASFQRHYDQKPDGIYGFQTDHQLKVAVRGKKSCRKNADKDPERLARCNKKYGPERDE